MRSPLTLIRGGNDLQRFRRERRVHAICPGGRSHARLEFSEKLIHCGAHSTGIPARVTKIRDASAHSVRSHCRRVRADTVHTRTITSP